MFRGVRCPPPPETLHVQYNSYGFPHLCAVRADVYPPVSQDSSGPPDGDGGGGGGLRVKSTVSGFLNRDYYTPNDSVPLVRVRFCVWGGGGSAVGHGL